MTSQQALRLLHQAAGDPPRLFDSADGMMLPIPAASVTPGLRLIEARIADLRS